MAIRNNIVGNMWQRVKEDSVSWGSLGLWICGVIAVVSTVAIFANF